MAPPTGCRTREARRERIYGSIARGHLRAADLRVGRFTSKCDSLSPYAASVRPTDLKPLFSIPDTIKGFAASNTFIDEPGYWSNLAKAVGSSYDSYIRTNGLPWTGAKSTKEGILFTASFVYVSKSGKPAVMLLNGRMPTVFTIEATTESLNLQSPRADGQIEAVLELKEGKNPAFDALRKDSPYARVRNHFSIANTSATDAIEFAKFLIQTTSRMHHIISADQALVSPNYDCSIVSERGVQSLARDSK